jgi:acyl-CoA reductase-like NAD-dependent aldehyde dehydrogenase
MRHTRARLPNDQFDLFHPPQTEPDWHTLPEPARQQAVKLLARMFREHQQQLSRAAAQDREVGDE